MGPLFGEGVRREGIIQKLKIVLFILGVTYIGDFPRLLYLFCYCYYLTHSDHHVMHHLQVVVLVNITGGRAEHVAPLLPGGGGGLATGGGGHWSCGDSGRCSTHTAVNIQVSPTWPRHTVGARFLSGAVVQQPAGALHGQGGVPGEVVAEGGGRACVLCTGGCYMIC